MTKLLLAVHIVFAIFAIGPLVHAATTAGRGIRQGDAAATTSSARLLRIYAYASVLVVITGIVLMYRSRYTSVTENGILYGGSSLPRRYADYQPTSDNHIASFGDTWIWVSLVLWAAAIALVLSVAVPTLNRATRDINDGDSAVALTGRVAAVGGVVGLAFVAITVLMVYRPGQ